MTAGSASAAEARWPTVLFVCKANRGRSVMSQALFERAAGGRHRAISAGSEAVPEDGPHPEVVEAMRELGIDVARRTPQRLTTELAAQADAVVTMGCGDACPVDPRQEADPRRLGPARPEGPPARRGPRHPRRHRPPRAALVADSTAARWRERAAVPSVARRVPRLGLPRRARDRLGDRRPAAVARRHGSAAARQLRRDRGRAVRDHPHVRPGLRRPLQPGRLARRRRLRRPLPP